MQNNPISGLYDQYRTDAQDFSKFAALRDMLNALKFSAASASDNLTDLLDTATLLPLYQDESGATIYDGETYFVASTALGRWVVKYYGIEGYLYEVDQVTGNLVF